CSSELRPARRPKLPPAPAGSAAIGASRQLGLDDHVVAGARLSVIGFERAGPLVAFPFAGDGGTDLCKRWQDRASAGADADEVDANSRHKRPLPSPDWRGGDLPGEIIAEIAPHHVDRAAGDVARQHRWLAELRGIGPLR